MHSTHEPGGSLPVHIFYKSLLHFPSFIKVSPYKTRIVCRSSRTASVVNSKPCVFEVLRSEYFSHLLLTRSRYVFSPFVLPSCQQHKLKAGRDDNGEQRQSNVVATSPRKHIVSPSHAGTLIASFAACAGKQDIFCHSGRTRVFYSLQSSLGFSGDTSKRCPSKFCRPTPEATQLVS